MENTETNKGWVIHYSADDYWNSNPHSRLHITEQFYKNYKILWVNPIGSRIPSIKKKGFSGRILRKIKTLLKFTKLAKKDFYVTTLLSIPVFHEGKTQRFNRFILKIQHKLIFLKLGIKEPVVFHTTPVYAHTLGMFKHRFAIYYYTDQYTAYREFDVKTRKYTEDLDRKLYKNVDVILCASQKIYDNVVNNTNVRVEYFPHQVNYSFFADYQLNEKPSDIKNIEKPIVGYYGSISDSNDWETIKYCAQQRPNYEFVFIGRKDIKNTGMETMDNVLFLGKKPFEELPAYGKSFAVGVMFWIRREWIINCSPLKLKEYLSLGIPVVSTEIEEIVKHYPDIVYSSRTKEEFLKGIDDAINTSNNTRISKGVDKVKDNNWYNAIKIIENEMAKQESLQTS